LHLPLHCNIASHLPARPVLWRKPIFRSRESCFHDEEIPMSAITTASGLTIEDTVIGEGPAAAAGRDVTVHYAGWLADGTQFDSSREKEDPFQFTLGKKEVMDGWEEGLKGMKVGGTRKLTIPPQLAYGEDGAGDTIPPNATLTFEVELLAVTDSEEFPKAHLSS
jgi:FKBP-type peptidyl-prolyl cis-trans isomerase FkpA